MNCKQGDLAVIVRSRVGNEGKVIVCTKLHTSTRRDVDGILVINEGPRWVLDHPVRSRYLEDGVECQIYTIPDCDLRPLRNDPGQDETLSWKDVPSTNEVAA